MRRCRISFLESISFITTSVPDDPVRHCSMRPIVRRLDVEGYFLFASGIVDKMVRLTKSFDVRHGLVVCPFSTRVSVKGGHVTVLANYKRGNANPACTSSVLRD